MGTESKKKQTGPFTLPQRVNTIGRLAQKPALCALSFVHSSVNPHAGTTINRTLCGAKMEDNIKDPSRPQMYLFGELK